MWLSVREGPRQGRFPTEANTELPKLVFWNHLSTFSGKRDSLLRAKPDSVRPCVFGLRVTVWSPRAEASAERRQFRDFF